MCRWVIPGAHLVIHGTRPKQNNPYLVPRVLAIPPSQRREGPGNDIGIFLFFYACVNMAFEIDNSNAGDLAEADEFLPETSGNVCASPVASTNLEAK